MSLSTPIAFFIFNRPDLTWLVFKAIATARPKQLFVVADGPRFPEESVKCEQTREVINKVDWECDVFTNFSDTNLGCGRRVSSGIDWVFSKVEEAIILEDDTLPIESFFPYCQALLEYYRHDERVMTIGGNNFQFGHRRNNYSYHFTKYNGCWGWATWRRAWNYYDYRMKTWPEFKQSDMLKTICLNTNEHKFWTNLFDTMYENPDKMNTWDHQWKYACWSQNGLAIEPCVNLVANLGFGHPDASHTTGQKPWQVHLTSTQEIRTIKHPPFIERDKEADNFLFDHVIGKKGMRNNDRLIKKIQRRLSKMPQKIKTVFLPS